MSAQQTLIKQQEINVQFLAKRHISDKMLIEIRSTSLEIWVKLRINSGVVRISCEEGKARN